MKVIFHEAFRNSAYASDGASVAGRMECIMKALVVEGGFPVIAPDPAEHADLLLAHSPVYIQTIADRTELYNMALLSAGGSILAAMTALSNNEPTFACVRPPGHHASKNSSWGYCAFCNMGIALLRLKEQGLITNAFVLDMDAHTGDGTIDVLSGWKDIKIVNPMADNNKKYLQVVEQHARESPPVDIVGVSAGFDAYQKDLGKKLTTFDFYLIGRLLKKMTRRFGHHRRFALLEGGYYLPDLGKNVLAFCQGFQDDPKG